MDCFVDYNQIVVAPKAKLKTIFTTIFYSFAWHVMSFVLCIAHATYQWFMHETFKDMASKHLCIYLDYLGVATMKGEHLQVL